MLFVLDQMVDTAVARMLRSHGHVVHTAFELGQSAAADGDLAVAVHELHGILISHDRRFSQGRSANVWGQHIWLKCVEMEADDVLERHLDDIVPMLERYADLFVEVGKEHLAFSHRWV